MKKLLFLLIFCLSIIRTTSAQIPNYPYTTLIVPFVDIPGATSGNYVKADGTGYGIPGGTNTCLATPGCVLFNGTTATTQSPLDNSANVATTAYTDAAVAAGVVPAYIASSGAIAVVNSNTYVTCTTTCTVTPLAPAAGKQLCIDNAPGVSTVITLAALGSGNAYSLTSNTGYGTTNHAVVAGGTITDAICIVGLDATHYKVKSFTGTWTD